MDTTIDYRCIRWVPTKPVLKIGEPCPICRRRVTTIEISEECINYSQLVDRLTISPCGCQMQPIEE